MHEKELYTITKQLLEKNIEDFSEIDLWDFWEIIKAHGYLYYQKEAPIISDSEYDRLFEKFLELKKIFSEEVNISEKIWNFQQSSFKKVAHSRPMISLDNTYNEEDLRDFDARVKKNLWWYEWDLEYMIEFKFDGVWIELIYENWKFIQAITRGNGLVWEDVTENVRQISSIPKTISYTDRFEIRWEIVMPLTSFERLNTEAKKVGWKVFSNPRNAASGSIRMIDNSITKYRELDFYGYDLANSETFIQKNTIETYEILISKISELWFKTWSYFEKISGAENLISQIENFWERKKHIDFEIDGLVVKVNDISLWEQIGKTEHHPRYAIAYKFPAEIQTTQIESVEHSVGRTGTITPVANVSPVNLWWAVIRRSTLHNYDEIQKLDVRVGDRVFIKRAWEVIPKIISVVVEVRDGTEQKIEIPTLCPSCHSQVLKDDSKVRYYCGNTISCPAQNREQLAHSVGKSWFDIDWLGERQIEIFLEQGLISNLLDIFSLKKKREEILELEWFQEKSVDKLLESIEKSRNMDLAKFIRSIGIPWVGKKTAKILAGYIWGDRSHTTTLSWILSLPEEKDATNEASFPNIRERIFATLIPVGQDRVMSWEATEKLQELPDIWPEVARSVVEFFTQRTEYISELLRVLNIEISDTSVVKEKITWKYAWKKMCITWSFEWYSRDQLVEILESQGWEFTSSVSKNTDYLLAGEKAGGKLKKATELWVEVLSLEEFMQ